MKFRSQRRLVSSIMKVGTKRVVFDPDSYDEIKEAITRADIRSLINKGSIKIKPIKGTSRVRARKRKIQKRKGRRKGKGSKKGTKTAKLSRKERWELKIRAQRAFLKMLKEKKVIDSRLYQNLRKKAKGGLFRSRRHIKLFLEQIKK